MDDTHTGRHLGQRRTRPVVVLLSALAIADGASGCSTRTSGSAVASTVDATTPGTSRPDTQPATTTADAQPITQAPSTLAVDTRTVDTQAVDGNAVDPNAVEIVTPGDIPDNQQFVPYSPSTGSYTVSVPEGWARTDEPDRVTFTDHFNAITIRETTLPQALTVDTMGSSGLADVAADPTYKPGTIDSVATPAGKAIRATYDIGSPVDSVTGKRALLSVERFVFQQPGRALVVTLSGAKGADNVDPWRIVRESVRFP